MDLRAAVFARAAVIVGGGIFLSACASFGGGSDGPARPPPTEGGVKVASRTAANSTIPVLVDDQPITKYDIDQRTRILRISGMKGGRKAATEELIDEVLQISEARRRRVIVPDGQVDQAYAGVAGQLKMTVTKLNQALTSEGIHPDSLKRRLRAQSSWGSLVRRRARAEAQISSAELATALQERGDPSDITVKEYVLQQIVFVVPAGSPAAAYTQRRREANAFLQRYKGCDNVLEQTRQLKGVVVKNIGRRSAEQLGGGQGEEIARTEPGTATAPFRTQQGVELIAVCSSREIRSNAVARTEIKNKYALEQVEGLGTDYLKELREAAIIVYR